MSGPGAASRERRADILAGLTVTLVGLPQCLAYALLSGLPPAYGLATAAVPGAVAALAGKSAQVVTGPTNTTGLLVLAALGPWLGPDGLLSGSEGLAALATLTLLAGLFRLALAAVGGAALVRFVPVSVLSGFTAGAGLLILVMQLDEALGLLPVAGGDLLTEAQGVAAQLRAGVAPSALAVAVTLSTAGAILVGRRVAPRLPIPLLVVAAGAVGAWLTDASRATGLPTVGDQASVPSGWPPGALPSLDPALWGQLLVPAMAITLLGTLELVVSAKARDARPDMGREIGAQGLANIAGAFASALPASASLTRSALLRLGGAQSRLAALAAAVTVVPVLLYGGALVERIPQASLAGVLLVVALGMLRPSKLKRLYSAGGPTALMLGLTFVGTLVLPLEVAILAGVGVGLGLHLARDIRPRIRAFAIQAPGTPAVTWEVWRPDAATAPAVIVVEVSGSLHYASVDDYEAAFDAAVPPQAPAVVVDLSHAHQLRFAALGAFERQHARCVGAGTAFMLAGVEPRFERLLARTGAAVPRVPHDPLPGRSVQRALQAVAPRAASPAHPPGPPSSLPPRPEG